MNNGLVWLLSFILPRRYWYRRFYLRSRHWRDTRQGKLLDKFYTCEKCGRTGWVDVHHLTYYRNGQPILWHEFPNDLQVLCRTCHKKEHERK